MISNILFKYQTSISNMFNVTHQDLLNELNKICLTSETGENTSEGASNLDEELI